MKLLWNCLQTFESIYSEFNILIQLLIEDLQLCSKRSLPYKFHDHLASDGYSKLTNTLQSSFFSISGLQLNFLHHNWRSFAFNFLEKLNKGRFNRTGVWIGTEKIYSQTFFFTKQENILSLYFLNTNNHL